MGNEVYGSKLPDPSSYERVLRSFEDGILIVDEHKRILFANEIMAEMYGMRPDEIAGKSCEEAIRFDHCIDCPHSKILEDGDSFTDHSLRCPLVPDKQYCVTTSPYRDSSGKVIGVVEIFRDMGNLGGFIDGMREDNVEIEHERRRLDAILGESSDGYFTASLDRQIQSIDAKLADLVGRSQDSAEGVGCQKLFGSNKCESDCPIQWAAEHGKNVIDCREEIETPTGTIPVDKSIFLQRNLEGEVEHIIGVLHNATELVALRSGLDHVHAFPDLQSRNARMEEIFGLIETFGPTDAAVLVLGESGTGKELIASALQRTSRRHARRFVKINCSALAEGLLESELFGHVRGAFTGAVSDKRGLFEIADGGTVFLDEVGDMSPGLQAKILRVLEAKQFEKVGGTTTIHVDVRIIAATNRDLEVGIRDGSFRKDLYYRLNAIQIRIPALRDRPEDIPLLADRFLREFRDSQGKSAMGISARALDIMQRHTWPGNVRELRNVIEFACVCARSERIERQDLPDSIRNPEIAAQGHGVRFEDEKAAVLRAAMQRHGGNRVAVAEEMGISRTTLWRRLKAMDIRD